MKTLTCLLVFGLAIGSTTVAARDAKSSPVPTPEIRRFDPRITSSDPLAYGAVATVGTQRIGFVIACTDGATEAMTTLGAYPPGKPVQLAVRTAGGRIERFGNVEIGEPRSGFHSPLLTGRSEVRRWIGAALRSGSLISNGHNSFWNRIPEAENAAARSRLLGCLDREPSP